MILFFFNDTATTEIYTLSLHDALPILSSRMRARVGFFWQARHSQIYPELARLEEGGLVTHHVVEQSDRPDKKVYEITDAGFGVLREWVIEPPAPRAARDELVLKAYSLDRKSTRLNSSHANIS